jgi:hypothetical protein
MHLVAGRRQVVIINPTIKVIGIFGSNFGRDSTTPPEVKQAELVTAELLAEAIHRQGALVLSGAAPRPDQYVDKPGTVKDVAAYAVRDLGDRESAAWIGVANAGEAREPRDHGSSGVIVTPGWGTEGTSSRRASVTRPSRSVAPALGRRQKPCSVAISGDP